jgi:hypothetical protein
MNSVLHVFEGALSSGRVEQPADVQSPSPAAEAAAAVNGASCCII